MQKSVLSARANKVRKYRGSGHNGPELENNFILRLPEPQAKILREDLRQGQSNVKDRLFIKLDYTQDKDDMRGGVITFDTIMYKARLVDLPSIMETWKTIDKKNLYKTADVCQMLMVREKDDPPEEEDNKKKKRDPNKVEKKYLWPHGYTPSMKNVRKRRFRKTLRKKHIDLPDIEKEVKRLLRADNEAGSIKWEIVREDDEKRNPEEVVDPSEQSNLDKQQLFGEISSSDDEIPNNINIGDEDDDSRLSVDDSHSYMNETQNSLSAKFSQPSSSHASLVTEFNSAMFMLDDSPSKMYQSSPMKSSEDKHSQQEFGSKKSSVRFFETDLNQLYSRLAHLDGDLTRLLSQRAAHQAETDTIENNTLKQKFLSKLADFDNQIQIKESEIMEVRSQLQDH